MPVHEYLQHARTAFPPSPSSAPTPAPTPSPMPVAQRLEMPRMRWARIYVFPRNARARLRHVPIRPPHLWRPREDTATWDLWSCRTSFMREQIVRAKYAWEQRWVYFEIKISIPLIPGFGHGNAALLQLSQCPAFVGEIAVVHREGLRLNTVADVRLEDIRKIEIAVTCVLRMAVGLDGRYRGSVDVEHMMSSDALDDL